MAHPLDTYDFSTRRSGRPITYPWNKWTDGRAWRLRSGEDFRGKPSSFRVLVHKTARNLGLKAITKTEDDHTMVIQFYTEDDT